MSEVNANLKFGVVALATWQEVARLIPAEYGQDRVMVMSLSSLCKSLSLRTIRFQSLASIQSLIMASSLPPGLTPPEVAFLCEMELVTVVPRQRLEGLELLGVSGTQGD